MDEDRRMPAALPGLLQTLERKPASLSITELRANELALRIDTIDDDVVKEIVGLAWSEDHLQHQDRRPPLLQFTFDECRCAGDEARIEALLPGRENHVDRQHAAACFRQRGVPLRHRRRIAVML